MVQGKASVELVLRSALVDGGGLPSSVVSVSATARDTLIRSPKLYPDLKMFQTGT